MKLSSPSRFKIGQCVRSANEAELGLGHITEISPSIISVSFSKALERRNYSAKSAPLERSTFSVGAELTLRSGKSLKVLNVIEQDELLQYETEIGIISESDVFSSKQVSHPLDCLRDGRVGTHQAFELRKQASLLVEEYKNSQLHGFIGSRVVLTPHQLYAVDKIVAMPHPRALLADEVGLGKTIEAALIFSKLKALGRAKKVLILVPEALKHQWLAELYRKFFELFILVDEDRWEEELKSQGANSFASNSFVLASLDLLIKEKDSLNAALKENWDLVIIDEAHQLIPLEKEAPETLKFFWQLSESVKSVLFLTATPYRFGEENFDVLVKLLQTSHNYPMEYIHNRRDIIQGFPQRILHKYEIEQSSEEWLSQFLKDFKGEKLLLICKSEEAATNYFNYLTEKTGFSAALFVESMDLLHRDKQAAWFASEGGAQTLICSEMGSEGRNFQFCHDMIFMDMPEHPDLLEQRIGRLDRIGQSEDVNIHIPFTPKTETHFLVKMYEEVFGIFAKPCPFAFKVFDRINAFKESDKKLAWNKFRDKALDVFEEEEKLYLKKVQSHVDERSFNATKAQALLKEIKSFEKSEKSDVVFENLMQQTLALATTTSA
ncbi:MAG: SNF2-related protein [Bdellovibrionota bacterium]